MATALAQPQVETYQPFARQCDFHRSPAKYRLFGGAAGPGKSRALLEEAIQQALEVDGSDCLLLRRTYPELEKSMIEPLRRWILPLYEPYGATFNESKSIFKLPNGANLYFGYCRSENDVYQYQGGEFLFIGIDELTHFTLKQWQFLTSRNRCPVKLYTAGTRAGKPVKACMAGATNPGNVGHAWVKALWIDHEVPKDYDRPDLYNPKEYDFIRARLDDNPIYASDAGYRATLEALPAHLRKAMLEGDWDVFAGQYFDVFSKERHVHEMDQDEWWNRWISVDWGFKHPSAVYWHARTPENRVHTYREKVQNGLSPKMLGQAIADLTGSEKIETVYLSPDAFGERISETSIADEITAVLEQNGLPRCVPADDNRVNGWQLMYQLLESDMWSISAQCKELVKTLPMLVYDEKKIEDVAKMEGDDPADGARYGIFSQIRVAPKPIGLRIADRFAQIRKIEPHVTDTQLMMARTQIEKDEKAKLPHSFPIRRRMNRWASKYN